MSWELVSRGVSGSDKTNEMKVQTEPNQTEKISDLVWFGLKLIRTNRNRSNLVWFMVFHFEIRETDEPIQ